ncbi:MAG: FAD:protein FMN transferase [Luminiphilus sp.]|nr:FAD:protein FMN transferase [Luminiphilus sp.]
MIVLSKRRLRPALLLAFCCLAACSGERPQQLGGNIFGTTWAATYQHAPDDLSAEAVKTEIESAFELVNLSMNHYDPESVISDFNQLPPGEPLEVDWDFAYVLTAALALGEATGGAYDVSVSALSDLWGFGPDGPTRLPTQGDIDLALSQVGVSHLEWQPETRTLAKRVPNLKLDFSSLAKGYAVDLAADALDELGLEHYMLEVGGEVRVRGQSPRGGDWRIAVERPDPTARGSVQTALSVSDTGIATSGDYRNFFESEGRRYSHLIDPKSGYPIQHDVVSVTVVHGSAMMADAWATALIVLGSEEAMALAEERRLAVYLLKRSDDRIEALWSASMAQWLDEDLL